MTLFGYIRQDSDEKKIVEKITSFKHKATEQHDLLLFYNLLFDPVRQDGSEDYEGFYVGTNIQRHEMTLERKGRPGDFDILFIPYSSEKLYFERTAVYEVKIARPSFAHVDRNANSLGETQIKGLLEDGFPLVGLLHVVVPEPLLIQQASRIKMGKQPVNIDWQPGDPPQPKFEDLFEWQPLDWLPWAGLDRQMKRLISAGFPKHVGLNAFALTQTTDGRYQTTISHEYRGYTSGYFNPKKSAATIQAIESHFNAYGESRYRKLSLTGKDVSGSEK